MFVTPRILPAMLVLAAFTAATTFQPPQALAQSAGPTLEMGLAAPPNSVDPHYYTLTPNIALGNHVFEALVDRSPEGKPLPGLAESWQAIDETTWEFRLRRGVKWHNGQDFTAEDVAYTID
ncbi:ABC transporter substrate-binding protein, partial [Roseomonas mucosa]